MPVPRARRAAIALFALTGLVFATWAARIPAVQERLDLAPAELGLVLLALEGGAVAGLPAGGALVARWGGVACLRAAFVVFPGALVAVVLAPGLGSLAAVAALWGASNSLVDVALNAQGVELERRTGAPVLGGLHAGHSLGLLAGAVVALGAAAAGLPLAVHVCAVAAAACAAGLAATRALVAEARSPARAALARPDRRLLRLGAVAAAAFALDAVAGTWVAVHLGSVHGAGPALATAGYTGFVAALAAGRLAADRLVARHGGTALVRGAGALAAAGGALVVLAPSTPVAVTGWLVVGLAAAPLAPALLGGASAVTGGPAPAALAAVSTVGYLGGFAAPPLVGLLAGPLSLSAALGVLVLAGLAVVLLAGSALPAEPRPARARRKPSTVARPQP